MFLHVDISRTLDLTGLTFNRNKKKEPKEGETPT